MGSKRNEVEIRTELNAKGFTFMDPEYHGMVEKSTLMDQDGYLYEVKLGNLLCSEREPEKFRRTNPYTIFNINHYFELVGVRTRVLSDTYMNAHQKMRFSCDKCGRTYEADLNHVISRNQIMCPDCSRIEKGIRHRVDKDTVRNEFLNSGLTPLFDKYNGCDEKLRCLDKSGHSLEITYRSLSQRNKIGYTDYSVSRSRYESLTQDYLDELGVSYIPQYTCDGCEDKRRLHFDFAIFGNDSGKLILIIEADGQQHFQPVRFEGNADDADRAFDGIRRRDEIKDRFCQEQNIEMLRIPYFNFENGRYKNLIKEKLDVLQSAAA